jgi:hypothetical protein
MGKRRQVAALQILADCYRCLTADAAAAMTAMRAVAGIALVNR